MEIHARGTPPSRLVFLLSAVLALVVTSPGRATTTTWQYTATVRNFRTTSGNEGFPTSFIALGIDVGTSVTGYFVLDDTLPDTSPGDTTTGTYPGSAIDGQFVAGDLTLSIGQPGGVTVALDRFFGGFPPEGLSEIKLYASSVQSSIRGLLHNPFFELDLVDSGQDVITSEAFPSAAPALTDVDPYNPNTEFPTGVAFGFGYNDSGQSGFAWAELTSLTVVPEPGTCVLLGMGLSLAMGASRRRARR